MEKEIKKTKEINRGITLVSLVITIIILLILAGISIATLTGSGLFEKAKLAKERTEERQKQEEQFLGDYQNKIGQYVNSNRDTVTIDKSEYEELKANVAKLENNPVVLYNNSNYTSNSSTTPLLAPAGTTVQTITLLDTLNNYEKIEINLGCVAHDGSTYYYPYMETITWHPKINTNPYLYVHKATNFWSNQYVRWQVDTSKNSNQLNLYTWEKGSTYWQGIFLISVLGYK